MLAPRRAAPRSNRERERERERKYSKCIISPRRKGGPEKERGRERERETDISSSLKYVIISTGDTYIPAFPDLEKNSIKMCRDTLPVCQVRYALAVPWPILLLQQLPVASLDPSARSLFLRLLWGCSPSHHSGVFFRRHRFVLVCTGSDTTMVSWAFRFVRVHVSCGKSLRAKERGVKFHRLIATVSSDSPRIVLGD